MRRHSRLLYSAGLLCLAAVVWLWILVRQDVGKRNPTDTSANTPKTALGSPSNAAAPNAAVGGQPVPGRQATTAVTTPGVARTGAAANAGLAAAGPPRQVAYRLSNTDQSLSQLGRSDTAILLENALIDTASPTPLAVPEHLRASGDPGSYLVQWRRPLDKAFYARLREAGAEFVSYIP